MTMPATVPTAKLTVKSSKGDTLIDVNKALLREADKQAGLLEALAACDARIADLKKRSKAMTDEVGRRK